MADIDIFLILEADLSRSVVGVLDLHANVGSFIDCCTCCSLLPHADAHVEVKALIDLILAVLDAGDLCGTLCREIVRVDAVEVALAEEQGRQSCLL